MLDRRRLVAIVALKVENGHKTASHCCLFRPHLQDGQESGQLQNRDSALDGGAVLKIAEPRGAAS